MKRFVSLAVLIFMAIGFLAPIQPVQASGETYTYHIKDENISGDGGAYFNTPTGYAKFSHQGPSLINFVTTDLPAKDFLGLTSQCTVTLHADTNVLNSAATTFTARLDTTQPSSSKCTPADIQKAFGSSTITTNNSIVTVTKKDDSILDPKDSASQGCDAGHGLTWLICPGTGWLSDGVDGIETNLIAPFLKASPLSQEKTDPRYMLWDIFKNLASAGFVLVFLIIIFANTLSFNIDAYTIKKTLPRLVAAVVLIQFSYLICGIMIDVTNVLGNGVIDLVNNALKGVHVAGVSGARLLTDGGALIGLGILAKTVGAAAAGGVISSALSGFVLMALFTAFLAVIAVIGTIFFRQTLITLLVILSPLALLAWVLPNTEKTFYKWWDVFWKTLLMYPIIMLIFAAGKIVSITAMAEGGAFADIIGLAALAVPMFMIPWSFKFAGSGVNGIRNGLASVRDRGRSAFKNSRGYKEAEAKRQQAKDRLASGAGPKRLGLDGALGRAAGTGVWGVGRKGKLMQERRSQEAFSRLTADKSKELDAINPNVKEALAVATNSGFDDLITKDGVSKERVSTLKALARDHAARAMAGNVVAATGTGSDLQKVENHIAETYGANSPLAQQHWRAVTKGNSQRIKEMDPVRAIQGNTKKLDAEFVGTTISGLAGSQLGKTDTLAFQNYSTALGNNDSGVTLSQIIEVTDPRVANNMTAAQKAGFYNLAMKSRDPEVRKQAVLRFAPKVEQVQAPTGTVESVTTAQIRNKDEVEARQAAMSDKAFAKEIDQQVKNTGKYMAHETTASTQAHASAVIDAAKNQGDHTDAQKRIEADTAAVEAAAKAAAKADADAIAAAEQAHREQESEHRAKQTEAFTKMADQLEQVAQNLGNTPGQTTNPPGQGPNNTPPNMPTTPAP